MEATNPVKNAGHEMLSKCIALEEMTTALGNARADSIKKDLDGNEIADPDLGKNLVNKFDNLKDVSKEVTHIDAFDIRGKKKALEKCNDMIENGTVKKAQKAKNNVVNKGARREKELKKAAEAVNSAKKKKAEVSR